MVRKNPAMTAKSTENAKKCDQQAKDASKNGKHAKRLRPPSDWVAPGDYSPGATQSEQTPRSSSPPGVCAAINVFLVSLAILAPPPIIRNQTGDKGDGSQER